MDLSGSTPRQTPRSRLREPEILKPAEQSGEVLQAVFTPRERLARGRLAGVPGALGGGGGGGDTGEGGSSPVKTRLLSMNVMKGEEDADLRAKHEVGIVGDRWEERCYREVTFFISSVRFVRGLYNTCIYMVLVIIFTIF